MNKIKIKFDKMSIKRQNITEIYFDLFDECFLINQKIYRISVDKFCKDITN